MNKLPNFDRWLTTPPDDGFDGWCEQITEAIPDKIFNQHEDFIMDSKAFEKWLDKLFRKDRSIEQSVAIIVRALQLYKR
jgi:hypothetical protein